MRTVTHVPSDAASGRVLHVVPKGDLRYFPKKKKRLPVFKLF